MKEKNILERSLLHKLNTKIHRNLWKAYTLSLIVCFIIVAIKGFS